jgi:hypothetical protein
MAVISGTDAQRPSHLRKASAKLVWRSLGKAGCKFSALYRVALDGYGLFTTEMRRGRSMRRYIVKVNYDSRVWSDYVRIIKGDVAYSRAREWTRLLLATEESKRILPAGDVAEPVSYGAFDVVAEGAFNKTAPGADDIKAISVLEDSVFLLDPEVFETMVAEHEGTFAAMAPLTKSPQLPEFWRTFDKAEGQLNSWRGIRAKLNQMRLGAYVPTKSTYLMELNGRFQARHFGLGEVPSDWRRLLFRDRHGSKLVGADINSSWLQNLAEFTGDEPLREMLKGEPFKVQAAEVIWAKHKRSKDPFELPAGYTGQGDPHLQALCKNAPMTALYGSPLREISNRLGEHPEDYGPGLSVEMLRLLLRDPDLHLGVLLDQYLPAGKRLTWRAWRADGGIVIVDGDSQHQWNHIRTAPMAGAGDSRTTIYIDVPVDAQGRPMSPDAGGNFASNPYKLQQVFPPCFVHRMDGRSNRLVVNDLSRRGIEDIGAIHDCWLVRADREADLHEAIRQMGRPWFEGLGPNYELFERYLGDDKDFGPWVRQIRETWEARVRASDWPVFQWSPAK